jgi:hypothetical protein
MTTVTLSELLSARDESIALRRTRPRWHARVLARVRATDWKPARVGLMAVVLAVAGFLSKHAIVLAGCAAFVVAAAIITPVAGWAVAGVALFFLEARRR